MMSYDQNGHKNSIEEVRALLSPYLDDEVTTEERVLVEATLAQSSELRHELATLQQTIAIAQNLPRIPAPRPFTLTEADIGRSLTAEDGASRLGILGWISGLKPVLGSLGVVVAVIIAVLYLVNGYGNATNVIESETMVARVTEDTVSVETSVSTILEADADSTQSATMDAPTVEDEADTSITDFEVVGESNTVIAEAALPPVPTAAPTSEPETFTLTEPLEAVTPTHEFATLTDNTASSESAAEAQIEATPEVVSEALANQPPVTSFSISGAGVAEAGSRAADSAADVDSETDAEVPFRLAPTPSPLPTETLLPTVTVEPTLPSPTATSSPASVALAETERQTEQDASATETMPGDTTYQSTQLQTSEANANLSSLVLGGAVVLLLLIAVFIVARYRYR